MADLGNKQVAMAKSYVGEFGSFLAAYYKLVNVIGRAADAGIVWDDTTLDGAGASLAHLDAADITAAEALITQLVTYLGQVPSGSTITRRAMLERMTSQ